jgi:hypothetical protein
MLNLHAVGKQRPGKVGAGRSVNDALFDEKPSGS